jgi:purine-nucleoside phosphorylase
MSEHIDLASDVIRERAGDAPIEIAIILSAGLSDAVGDLENEVVIPYADLPGFPQSRSFGQENTLHIGNLEGVRIACLKGRSHHFESGNSTGMALPLELMALHGVQTLLVTTTCGSVDADTYPGSMAIVTDHINLSGNSPLHGESSEGNTFSLSKAYDERLLLRMKRAALSAGVTLRDGVYMQFPGPTFETPAEARMARMIGAHLIGMSGLSEVILARRLNLRTAFIGAVSYFGAGFHKSEPNYLEMRVVARQAAISLRRLIRAFLVTKEGQFAAEPTRPSILRKQILS